MKSKLDSGDSSSKLLVKPLEFMIESSSCGSDERLSEEVEVRDSHAEDVLELEEDVVLERLRVLLIRYEEYVDRSLYSLELCFLFVIVQLLDSDD